MIRDIFITNELLEDAGYSPSIANYVADNLTAFVEMNINTGAWTGGLDRGAIWDRLPTPAGLLAISIERWACWHCGGKSYTEYTCNQCSAPTAQWWARLDRMIAKRKRGG